MQTNVNKVCCGLTAQVVSFLHFSMNVYMLSIQQNHLRIEEFLISRDLPMVGEMRVGPFISLCGICLSHAFNNQEYKSTVKDC